MYVCTHNPLHLSDDICDARSVSPVKPWYPGPRTMVQMQDREPVPRLRFSGFCFVFILCVHFDPHTLKPQGIVVCPGTRPEKTGNYWPRIILDHSTNYKTTLSDHPQSLDILQIVLGKYKRLSLSIQTIHRVSLLMGMCR